MNKRSGLFLILFFTAALSYAQEKKQDGVLPNFTAVNRHLSEGEESGSVRLDAAPGDGVAWKSGGSFKEGTIEFDVKGKNVYQLSFVGIAFHGLDDQTYEVVYFRPFNFKTDDPLRKVHQVQYISLPSHDWEMLRNTFPGLYEKPVSPIPDPNDWFHVIVKVESSKIRVFLKRNPRPVLEINSLAKKKGFMIGFWVGNGSDGTFKNLSLREKL